MVVSPRNTDPGVFRAWRYLKEKVPVKVSARGQLESALAAERRAAGLFPELYVAERIFTKERHPVMRWMLEALLMTREPFANVAAYTGLSQRVVEVYEQTFFDVRSRLDMPGCIHAIVFGPMTSTEIPVHDPDKSWKYLAYHGGYRGFTYMITLSPGSTSENKIMRDLIRAQASKLAFRSVSAAPIIAETVNANIQTWFSLDEAARNAPVSTRHLDEMEAGTKLINSAIVLAVEPSKAADKIPVDVDAATLIKRLATGKTPLASKIDGDDHG